MTNSNGAIVLSYEYFRILIEKILHQFKEKHQLHQLPKNYQLYGYDAFDETLPNLKSDFEALGHGVVNGKYLYDKLREFEKGKEHIRLNQHYKQLIFLYIGYPEIEDFFEANPLSEEENSKQKVLLQKENNLTYYYLNYYFGEDHLIIKGQTIISENWKKIRHTFLYPMENGGFREHYSHGNIKLNDDMLNIRTKTLSGEKYIDGASEIYYIGHKSLENINYLIGTYCTFDIYTNTVAGKSILEKCIDKEDMIQKSLSPIIPPYIAQEIRNQRLVNNVGVPQHALELSNKSPYASLYGQLPGYYHFRFLIDQQEELVEVDFSPLNYTVKSATSNVYIEENSIELINKGSVVNFRFHFSGVLAIEQVNIYVKTYFLRQKEKSLTGVYSGLDYENRPVHGKVIITHKPYHKVN